MNNQIRFRVRHTFFRIFIVLSLFSFNLVFSDILLKETFSVAGDDALPKKWKELKFKKIDSYTKYEILNESGNDILKATSNNSASGLILRISFQSQEYPIISWRWKIKETIKSGDVRSKKGDDYAARLYVAFRYNPKKKIKLKQRLSYKIAKSLYGEYPPDGVLNYIWANHAKEGLRLSSAYTKAAKMIVLKSGNAQAGSWVTEIVNIYEDYKSLFKKEPPLIDFIAVMCDTDNTKEFAVSYFDDIIIRSN